MPLLPRGASRGGQDPRVPAAMVECKGARESATGAAVHADSRADLLFRGRLRFATSTARRFPANRVAIPDSAAVCRWTRIDTVRLLHEKEPRLTLRNLA